MNLQTKLTAALVALVSVFTLVQAGLAIGSMHEQEDDMVDQMVAEEARRLGARIARLGPQALGPREATLLSEHYRAWWQAADGRCWPEPVPPELTRLSDGPHVVTQDGTDLHHVVTPVAGGRLYLVYDAIENETRVRLFRTQVLVLALLFMALSWVVARWLSGLLVGPLRRVTQLLTHWAPDPGGAPPATDEADALLAAFRRVQGRWEEGLAQEEAHRANLRHELRTPLAALRTDLEMALLNATHDPGLQQRLQRALTSADAVAGALQAVSNLPSAGTGAPVAPTVVAVHACVRDAWDSLGDRPATRGLRLLNEVPPQAARLADRHALLTILSNLMRNAVDHAAPACCRVWLRGDELCVDDDGPGIAGNDLPFVFDRYFRGRLRDAGAAGDPEPDRGLGLAISRQLAERHGWTLTVQGLAPHGTRFILRLGPG